MVRGAAVCERGGKYPGRARVPDRIFNVQGKHFYLGDYRSRRRTENHFDRAVRARTSSDVYRSPDHAGGRASRAWLVVGIAHGRCDDPGDRLETTRRGEISCQEPRGLLRVSECGQISPAAVRLVTAW